MGAAAAGDSSIASGEIVWLGGALEPADRLLMSSVAGFCRPLTGPGRLLLVAELLRKLKNTLPELAVFFLEFFELLVIEWQNSRQRWIVDSAPASELSPLASLGDGVCDRDRIASSSSTLSTTLTPETQISETSLPRLGISDG